MKKTLLDLTQVLVGLEAGSQDLLRLLFESNWTMALSRATIRASGEVWQLESNGLIKTSKRRGLVWVVNNESVRDSITRFFEEGGIQM